MKHHRELARNIRNFKYERSEHGIVVPSMGLIVGGTLTHWLNGEDPQHEENLITTEGLNHMLETVLDTSGTRVTQWYVAVYGGSASAGLTGDNFNTNASEFTTEYDEATRPQYDLSAATATGGSISNSANKADFTFNTGATVTGAAIVSWSSKSDGSGTDRCFAAADFGSSRSVVDDDVLTIQYTVTIANS